MKLKGFLITLGLSLITTLSAAKSKIDLTGEWKVIDDMSGFTLVKVKISAKAAYHYNGHIIEAFSPPNQPTEDLSGMKGFHLLLDLKQDPNNPHNLVSGQVFDPDRQLRYNIKGKVNRNGNSMILRSPSDADKASRKLSWVRIRSNN